MQRFSSRQLLPGKLFSFLGADVVPRLRWWIALLILGGCSWNLAQPAYGQALLPPLPEPDREEFERRGILLAQLALRQTIFRPDDRFDWEWALPRVQVAAEIAPNSFQALLILGSVHLQLQQSAEAVAALESARTLAPESSDVLFSLGSAYFLEARYGEAAAAIERGLESAPETPDALFDLGNAYLKLNRPNRAIAAYEKAFAREGAFWPAINNVGLVLYERGEVSEAVENWQTAVAIDGSAAEPQLAIAVATFVGGDVEGGTAQAIAALNADGRYADLEFLAENLWGEQLLTDTKRLFAHPNLQPTLERLKLEDAAP